MTDCNLKALEYRIGTIEAFLTFDPNAPASSDSPDTIHDLLRESVECTMSVEIAEAMTGVTLFLLDHVARLEQRLVAMELKQPC